MKASPWLSVFIYTYQLFFSPNMISLALTVCLGSLWYWKIKPFPIRHFPERMAWWIQTCLNFPAFMIPSIWTISPTALAETQPQTRTDPPPCFTCFTEGCKSSVKLFFSHIVDDYTQKFQTWIHHSIILFSTDNHSNLCLFTCSPSKKVVSWLLPFHKDHSWSSFIGLDKGQLDIPMNLPDAEPGPCWTSSGLSKKKLWETSHRILKVFLAFQSFIWLDLSRFFKYLLNSLNTTSSVSSLFADSPLRVALLMKNYDFMSVKFGDLWHFKWNGVTEIWSYTN